MAVLVFIFLGLLLIVLQTTVFMLNPVWVAAPDLFYILVAYLAYRFDLFRGLLVLLPVSVAMDVFSGVILGIYPAICLAAFALLKILVVKMPVRESYYQVPFVGVSYLLVNKAAFLAITFLKPDVPIPWSWPMMLLRVLLLMLFAFPLFRFFEFIDSRLQHSPLSVRVLGRRSGNVFRQEGEE
ncbi:MAG TPA: hypothetical protein DDY20_06280 [Desulfobulbaceae bacterium]|nr:hypothetical protein [Desulfobulbaceae bacterium]